MNPSSLKSLLKLLPLAVWTMAAPWASAADSPLVIPFQGQVTNQQNQLVATGQYSIIFNLYDVAVGGQPLWTERHSKVGVTNGMVNVFLGSITSLAQVDFSQTRYLGITIDVDDKPTTADPEMIPRQMIIPAFHAKRADNSTKLVGQDWSAFFVDSSGSQTNDTTNGYMNGAKLKPSSVTTTQIAVGAVQTSTIQDSSVTSSKIADNSITAADLSSELQQASIIPAGSIFPFAGPASNIPSGWRLCDGSALKSADYPGVYSVIGIAWGNGTTSPTGAQSPFQPGVTDFNLPDLRGMFLRGLNGSRNDSFADSIAARVLGSNQASKVGSHTHGAGTANPNGTLTARVTANDNGNVHADHRDLPGWVSNYWVSDGSPITSFYTVSSPAPKGAVVVGDTSVNGSSNSETVPSNAAVNYIIKL